MFNLTLQPPTSLPPQQNKKTVLPSAMSTAAVDINDFSTDLLHHILSLLPLPSLLRSTSVCKLWRSLILSSPSSSSSWFFLLGVHNTSSRNHQSFAFDPVSSSWHLLPSPLDSPSSVSSHSVSPLLFSISSPLFSFSTPFHPLHLFSLPPLHFPRINPLVTAISSCSSFIVVGGVKFIGNLVDIEDNRLPVEIFYPDSNSWRLHDPLPPEFHPANSSFSLSSALLHHRLYVFGISSHLLSSFDLDSLSWSPVVPLGPPGLQSGFLISCREKLLLAGLSNAGAGESSFNLWEIHDGNGAAGFARITVMPVGLLEWLVEGSGEDENKYASIKCVGAGDLVYVFNEEYYRKYPACVCDVGKGEWRRLPELSSPFNKFHKVITFSSEVSIRSVMRQEGAEFLSV